MLHDLAVSAVVYDTLLVVDLLKLLAPRLPMTPLWTGAPVIASGADTALLDGNVSRVALVLVQRLWGHDPITRADVEVLRDRARQNPKSIVAVSLDRTPLPEWMSGVQRLDLATTGVDGIAAFVVDAIVEAGGHVKPASKAPPSVNELGSRWPDPPIPYLGQPRAHGALRRELDLLVAELDRRVVDTEIGADRVLEVHTQPHRSVARIDDVGVSFSWVPARSGSVADGRLMVIEWSGMVGTIRRGAAALQAARPVHECLYLAEANDPDHWCWRAEGPNGRATSTVHLVGEWIAAASMSARELASR